MALPDATSLFDMSCEHSGPKLFSNSPLGESYSTSRSSDKPCHGSVKLVQKDSSTLWAVLHLHPA